MVQPEEAPHVATKGMWVSKLSLRTICCLFDVILIGLTGHMAAKQAIAIVVFCGPPAVVSFVWCLAEAISILVRGGHRGIHPGANVALDLLLWLAFAAATAMAGIFGLAYDYLETYDNECRYDSYGGYYCDYQSDNHVSLSGVGRAAVAFSALLTLLHFSLFVIACVETHRRNRIQSTIVYVPQGHQSMYMGPPGQQQYAMYPPNFQGQGQPPQGYYGQQYGPPQGYYPKAGEQPMEQRQSMPPQPTAAHVNTSGHTSPSH